MTTIAPLELVNPREIQETAILAELERVISSSTFHAADAQRKFLRYAVENAVAGQVNRIKEVCIGIEVFNRGPDFDPRLDTIVRVEASKLRVRLAKYYQTEGVSASIRIVLPPRGYVPAFVRLTGSPAVDAEPKTLPAEETIAATGSGIGAWLRSRLTLAFIALGLLTATIAVFVFRQSNEQSITRANPSIAVLPFRNLGEIREDDSLSDGLADELIDSLARVRGLRVVARTSALQFRNGDWDVRDVGSRLNVQMILEGSIARYGNRLRISAQLDDTKNGLSIWSSTFERDTGDLLAVEREIALAIVDKFSRSAPFQRGLVSPVPPPKSSVRPEAYRAYLMGNYFWNKQTLAAINTAIDHFQEATAKDPTYARAWAGLAKSYAKLPAFSALSRREAVGKIREAARRSLTLDPDQGESHIYLGSAAVLNHEWTTAEREFKLGLSRDPGDAMGHRWYANYLLTIGDAQKALAQYRIAQDLDPVSPYILTATARALWFLGRDEEAIADIQKALDLDPHYGGAHEQLAEIYVRRHMYEQAIANARLALAEMGNDSTRSALLAFVYASSNRVGEAREILNELLSRSDGRSFPVRGLATIYIGLGDNDRAFELLRRSLAEADGNLLLKVSPVYENLRGDKRYADLLKSMGLD
jgi:TolB-like protein/Tfp pilus assembly protein PilF